jgi:hypothetical protein
MLFHAVRARRSIVRTSRRALPALALWIASAQAMAQDQVFLQQFGTSEVDRLNATVADGTGGVFAGGRTSGSLAGSNAGLADAWIARYDSGGSPLWIRQIGTIADDSVEAMASDGAGGVYACGVTDGDLGPFRLLDTDAWIARYDAAGNQLWLRQFGSYGADQLHSASPSHGGFVFMCGTTNGEMDAGSDAWVTIFDSSGFMYWVTQIDTGHDDEAFALAPDADGGCFLGGATHGQIAAPPAGGSDIWLVRLTFDGDAHWMHQFGSSSDDELLALTPDGSGGVYACASTAGDLAGANAGSTDVWLARYDSEGLQQWEHQFGTESADSAQSLAQNGIGGVVLIGQTEGSLAAPNAGSSDAWLGCFEGTGHPVWKLQLGTAADDFGLAAAPDGAGGVFVGGATDDSLGGASAGLTDAWLARYDAACSAGTTYCNASITSIPRCQASIGASGSPSLSDPNGYTITSGNVPGGTLGLCIFGNNGAASTPIGTLGGKLCVKPPFVRSLPKSGGGTAGVCDGSFSFTLQDLIDASPIVASGAQIHAQIWARDPNPDGFQVSNGLQFSVCP